jgi:hypothetical protein
MRRPMHLAAACLALAASALALVGAPVAGAQEQRVDPQAIEALRKMGAHLRTLKSFTLTADTTQDEVLDNGQKIQVSGLTTYNVRIPDRLKLEVDNDRRHRIFYYDGKTVTQVSPEDKLYATFDAPDTITKTIDLARKRYGVSLPLADLFYAGTDEDALNRITDAFLVSETLLDGHWCSQYAYRAARVDFQVWIRKEGDPLPCELVTIDRTDPAGPKDDALITIDPNVTFTDDVFVFTPSEGMEKIAFETVLGVK